MHALLQVHVLCESRKKDETVKAVKFAFGEMGTPAIMQADNAAEFVHGVDEYCQQLNIKTPHSRVNHPQTQGCVERNNGDAKNYLCALLYEEIQQGRRELFTKDELKGMPSWT